MTKTTAQAPQWPYLPWLAQEATGAKLAPFEIVNSVRHKVAYVGSREQADLIVTLVNGGKVPAEGWRHDQA